MALNKRHQAIGGYLKKSRKINQITQRDMARAIGCHPQFVSNIERGLAPPPNTILPRWLSVLRINKGDWIKFELKLKKQELETVLSQMKAPPPVRRQARRSL